MRLTAEGDRGTSDRVAAALATLVVVGLPTFLLVLDEPIDHSLFLILRLIMSVSAAVLGGTIPGFLDINSTRIALVARVTGAIAFFALAFALLPEILSKFDVKSWLGFSSAVFGFGILFAVILSAVATTYSFYMFSVHIADLATADKELKILHDKTTLS